MESLLSLHFNMYTHMDGSDRSESHQHNKILISSFHRCYGSTYIWIWIYIGPPTYTTYTTVHLFNISNTRISYIYIYVIQIWCTSQLPTNNKTLFNAMKITLFLCIGRVLTSCVSSLHSTSPQSATSSSSPSASSSFSLENNNGLIV